MNKILKSQAGFSTARIIIAAVVVVAVLTVFFMLKSKKQEPIKIGTILSITGPGAYNGEEVKDGMILAVDEINTWGGINGKKIELVIKDSKSNLQESMKAFNKIEADHRPLLYVAMLSSVSMALAPLAKEKKVVLVGLVAATPKLTQQNEWVFRFWHLAELEVPPILSILQKLKVKKLGVLYLNDEYGTSVSKIIKKNFEATGGTVKSESFERKEVDCKKQITRLKDMDAIYSIGYASHLKNAFKKLREENFQGFILGAHGASGPIVTSMPEANGAYIAAPIIYNPGYLFAKELKEKYKTRYNRPLTQYAANGYDFMKLMAGLLEDKKVSRESVKSVLEEGFIYSGVFGSIDVKPGEHDIIFPLHPARIVDGEVKYIH